MVRFLYLFTLLVPAILHSQNTQISIVIGPAYQMGDLYNSNGDLFYNDLITNQTAAQFGFGTALSIDEIPKKTVGFSFSFIYQSFKNDADLVMNSLKYANLDVEVSDSRWRMAGLFIGPNFFLMKEKKMHLNLKPSLGFILVSTPSLVMTGNTFATNMSVPSYTNELFGSKIVVNTGFPISDHFEFNVDASFFGGWGTVSWKTIRAHPSYSHLGPTGRYDLWEQEMEESMTILSLQLGLGISYLF